MSAIWGGFRRLADFSGRDRRGRFWPYALVVIALTYVGVALAIMPMMAKMFAEAARYAAEHPEQATVVTGPGYYSVQIHEAGAVPTPDFGLFFGIVATVVVAAVFLLAAAVTRRLHDTGRAGWWGLPPLVFLTIGLTLFPRMMDSVMKAEAEAPPLDLFFLLFANNVLYVVCLIGLVVLLCLKGTTGTNRYGPEPG